MCAPASAPSLKDCPAQPNSLSTVFVRAAGSAVDSSLADLGKVGGYAAAHTRHDYTKFFAIIPRGYLEMASLSP